MAAAPRDASPPRAIRRLDYRPPAFLVGTLEPTLALDPLATRVSATLAFAALQRIAAAPQLSPDFDEVVTKALAE